MERYDLAKERVSVLHRFSDETSISSEIASGDEGRSAIWLFYLDYMFSSDLSTILFGADKFIYKLVPHNFFIYVFFMEGLLISIFAVWLIFRTFIVFINLDLVKYILPIFLSMFTSLFFLTSGFVIYYYILICGLLVCFRVDD